jgi:tight adherence protein C
MIVAVILVSVFVAGALGLGIFAMSTPKNKFAEEIAAIDASVRMDAQTESSVLRRLLDEGRRNKLESQLQQAGWYSVTPAKLFARAVGYGIVGAAIGVGVMLICHQMNGIFALLPIVFAIFAFHRPYAQLNGAAERRVKEVHRALPDFLDLLSTTVEAGIALNGAINIAAEGLRGALGEELRAAMQDVRLGRSRAEAMIAMAQRIRHTDLTTVVTALVQSERLGANVSTMLSDLSTESREARILRAEELAAMLSNKLVFPLALCMLPALMIMIFGGVLAKFVP